MSEATTEAGSGAAGARVWVVMGVSGCGKTTIGQGLAEQLGVPFCEGDQLHPAANIAKMSAGQPLTDDDRWPWLDRIAEWIAGQVQAGAGGVVSCSALRRSYRDRLRQAGAGVGFVFLDVDPKVLEQRMRERQHFMPVSLLASQLQTLERPGPDEAPIVISGDPGVAGSIRQALTQIQAR